MEDAFKSHYEVQLDAEMPERRKLTVIDMFSGADQNRSQYHFVFVLDESGSMSGSPWDELVRAYTIFLNKRLSDQMGVNDIISIIQFDDNARTTVEGISIHAAPRQLHCRGGGTIFAPALQQARNLIATTKDIPVLIFMSDGNASDGPSAITAIQAILAASPNVQVHTIAFGSSAGHQLLQTLARNGNGRFHAAINGIALGGTFSQIASGALSPLHQLATMVGSKLSQEVANKIVLDYL